MPCQTSSCFKAVHFIHSFSLHVGDINNEITGDIKALVNYGCILFNANMEKRQGKREEKSMILVVKKIINMEMTIRETSK